MDTLDKIELAMWKAHEYYKGITLDEHSRKVMESAFVDGYIARMNEETKSSTFGPN